ncbi:MAG: F0F1 ATP synthase subunit B, partial [Parasphingopyxis sp.]
EEADQIVTQAEADADALIERRQRLAEEKIAAAERSAVAEVRAKAASAATAAAAALIEQKHDAEADKALIDRTISNMDARLN